MLKNTLYLTILILSGTLVYATDPKEDIARYQESLKSASTSEEQTNFMIKLARAHVRDQEIEKGIRLFLEALEKTTFHTAMTSLHEKKLYEEALSLYLANHDPLESARQILKTYGKVAEKHPDYYLLNYLIAVSYANMGLFDRFFESYYLSYRHHPEEYLGYKAKAVLYSILHGKAKTEQEREEMREATFVHASKASELYPYDPTLYRMIVSFAEEKRKIQAARETITVILEKNIVVPRSDVLLYVRLALESGEKPLAQAFVKRAKEWYAYSRVIREAEQLVGG